MSRITPLAKHQLTSVRRAVDDAHAAVRKACDDAENLLMKMAKDKQIDDEDILAIVATRTAISTIRNDYE